MHYSTIWTTAGIGMMALALTLASFAHDDECPERTCIVFRQAGESQHGPESPNHPRAPQTRAVINVYVSSDVALSWTGWIKPPST